MVVMATEVIPCILKRLQPSKLEPRRLKIGTISLVGYPEKLLNIECSIVGMVIVQYHVELPHCLTTCRHAVYLSLHTTGSLLFIQYSIYQLMVSNYHQITQIIWQIIWSYSHQNKLEPHKFKLTIILDNFFRSLYLSEYYV